MLLTKMFFWMVFIIVIKALRIKRFFLGQRRVFKSILLDILIVFYFQHCKFNSFDIGNLYLVLIYEILKII